MSDLLKKQAKENTKGSREIQERGRRIDEISKSTSVTDSKATTIADKMLKPKKESKSMDRGM